VIFSSLSFLIFFIVLLAILSVLPWQRSRKLVLLASSYFFYGSWDYRFCALILASTLIDFFVGAAIHKSSSARRRKVLLLGSLCANLGALGFFKYYNFFIESAKMLLTGWGLEAGSLDIILPVGISFYTFQTLSYTIDIYRGRLEPADGFIDFALFVAFFPQLVAGPIVRASDFLPQLKRPIRLTGANAWAGGQIFLVGLFKKLMIADAVSRFVDSVYGYPEYYSSGTVWLAAVGYSLQIYCDFSGYSDMAIGCARILGFHFDRNFNMPYLSRSVTEFWQRWHISLSTWLRDYLYIPLGGNRGGQIRTYVNLMLTMLLGGLWHGASWNFVVWGGSHGVALALHRLWSVRRPEWAHTARGSAIASVVGWACTFVFVTVVWVLFRSPDTATTIEMFKKLAFVDSGGAVWAYYSVFLGVGFTVAAHCVGVCRGGRELVFFASPLSYRAAFAALTVLLYVLLFAPTGVSPFIYFQF